MSILSNQEYIDQIRQGDEKAYRTLFEQHYRYLIISAYQILKDQNLCRDVVQDVFLELWKKRSKLHAKIELLPYLKRSVINRSINLIKSRRHHMSSGPEPLNHITDDQERPDHIVEHQEFKNIIHKAIDKMPDRCRAIFMLCRMEGMSHAEIADKLEISTKTIENQMTKALRIMRQEIRTYQKALISWVAILWYTGWGIKAFELFTG